MGISNLQQIVKCDSHQLSAFQKCPQYFAYNYVLNIEPQKKKKYFEKGTFVSRILHIYYHRKRKGKDLKKVALWVFFNTYKYIPGGEDEVIMVRQTLMEYFVEYDKCNWKVLATEQGFSFILYEDADVKFIYEGRPDLVVMDTDKRIIAVDHKTQSVASDIYPYNNQAIGYSIATNAKYFVYNYLKFTQNDKFRRTPHVFSNAVKEDWKKNTIKWFWKILEAKQKVEFDRTLNCETKYGKCSMTLLCESPSEALKLYYITTAYKKRPRKWQAW